jgi:N-acetylglucosaminyl-diphospho-decaprenol L-rhamnosyltransferase
VSSSVISAAVAKANRLLSSVEPAILVLEDGTMVVNVTGEVVAVAVVTYNSASLIEDFVSSLDPGFAGIEYQLIVADNDSQDDTINAVRKHAPSALVIEMGRNAGYAAGINAAVAGAAPHSAVLAVNPDVRLGPCSIPSLLAALRKSGTGIAVPRLTDGRGQLLTTMRREPSVARAFGDAMLGARRAGWLPRFGEVVADPGRYESESLVDWAEGSTQLISSECWERCGPWDESYFLYSEETEFDLRARDAGYAVRFVPSAHATHLKGDSTTSPALWALLTTNRIRLFRRRNGPLRTGLYWSAYVLREASRSLFGYRTSRSALRALMNPASARRAAGPDWVN